MWISVDFPDQWRAVTVIPIPKPNKDHTDPLSYRPIALISCLCKVLDEWSILASSGILKNPGYKTEASVVSGNIVAQLTTWWVSKDISEMPLHKGNRQLVSSLTWRRPMKQPGNTVSSETFTGKASEADCLFSCQNISGTAESKSELGPHSDEFYPEEGVPTGGVLAMTCFGLKIKELPSCIARDVFRALYVDDLSICFSGRSLDPIERHLQQAVNAIQEWATRNGFRFAAHKCKVIHFTAPQSKVQRPPNMRIGNTPLPVEESTKFLGLWWDSHLSFKKHISVLKTVQGGSQPHVSGYSLEVGRGQRHTSDAVPSHCTLQAGLWLHCVWHSIEHQSTTTGQHPQHWIKTGIGSVLHQPSLQPYTEANEAPLEERHLKLSMHYYLKTRAFIDNPAHHALHEFDGTTREQYVPKPNGRGGMTRPPAYPIGLKVEAAMASAEIKVESVCPLITPSFPPGTHYDPKRHSLIEGVSKCMITRQEAQAKFNEYHETKDHMMKSILMAPKWTREWGQRQSSTAISWMVRQPAASCPKDFQTTAPSLLRRLQPSPWHWTITSTWAQFTTMWWSTLTQCPACRR